MAVIMLTCLISTLLALPASALAGDLAVATTSVPANGANVKVGTAVVYTITVTNTDTLNPSVATTLTDGVGTGAYVSDDSGGACVFASPTLTCPVPIIAPGLTWVVHVTVNAPAGAGPLTNVATIPADTFAGNNTATNTVNAVATLADVTIQKSHAAGSLAPGSDMTYNLLVSNAGPDLATGVVATDALNASLTFKSSTSGCTNAGQNVTCPVPDVASAGTQTVSFIVTISPTASTSTPITNTANVTTTTPESNASNNTSNTDSFTPTATPIDLGLTLAVDPTTAAPGDIVSYTVTVQNISTTADATNVVVTDALPAGLTPDEPPTTPSTGTVTVANDTWTWTIPTVAKTTSVTASFDAIVDGSTELTTITNTASVLGAQTDPISTNNTASVDLTITPEVADLDIMTAVDNAKPNKGDDIAIAIQISNAGPDDATNVVVKDVLPTGLKYNSCTGCEGDGLRRASTELFTVDSISVNGMATLVLNVTVQASDGILRNTATIVSADQSDPDGTDDQDTLQISVGATNDPGGTGGTSGSSDGTSGSGGDTAFSGFTAGQLMPWFLLLFALGLVGLEWSRRVRLVSPIGSTYGFDQPF